MKVAITGANGYIGGFVSRHVAQYHHVVALARQAKDSQPQNDQIEWCYGDLTDEHFLQKTTSSVDKIIHCAMAYNQQGQENAEQERLIVTQLIASNKPVIYTSSLFGDHTNEVIPESIQPSSYYWRYGQEKRIIDSGGSVIRLGFVYGGNAGYFWQLLKPDQKQQLHFVNRDYRLPMVHIDDVCELYLKVLENTDKTICHAWDGIKTYSYDILNAIAEKTGARLLKDVNANSRGLLNHSFIVSSGNTKLLGWFPSHGSVIESIDELIPRSAFLEKESHG